MLYLCLFIVLIILFTSTSLTTSTSHFLTVNSTGLSYANKPVFLSGANLAWVNYGRDFGLNQSQAKAQALQEYVHNLSVSGGNSMRVWLFLRCL